ncbi:hypothetical protein [Candidatus Burkholderia verschuerenii]|nr:hypothetical protein [Candidatus Burkholderia verschuerenii]
MFELLEDLLAVVTDFYGVQLHDLLRKQRSPEAHRRTSERDPPF